MKKSLFFLTFVLISILGTAQVATNFTTNDCSGTSTDLFTQLNAGKVVVLCWPMPCGSCIASTKTTYNVVASFQAANPDRVLFYLCDDYANTSCSALDGWAVANGIPASTFSKRFSDASINMSHYGTPGMPKMVVVGGSSHSVFYNSNNTVDATALQSAINDALEANGIEESEGTTSAIKLFPNPVNSSMNLTFTLAEQSNVTIEIYDILGQKVYNSLDKFPQGVCKLDINTNGYNNGIYFIKISDSEGSKTLRFNISH